MPAVTAKMPMSTGPKFSPPHSSREMPNASPAAAARMAMEKKNSITTVNASGNRMLQKRSAASILGCRRPIFSRYTSVITGP